MFVRFSDEQLEQAWRDYHPTLEEIEAEQVLKEITFDEIDFLAEVLKDVSRFEPRSTF